MILDHFKALSGALGERRAILSMRGILLRYSKGLPHSTRFRGSITGMKNLENLLLALDQYLELIKDEAL